MVEKEQQHRKKTKCIQNKLVECRYSTTLQKKWYKLRWKKYANPVCQKSRLLNNFWKYFEIKIGKKLTQGTKCETKHNLEIFSLILNVC